MEIHLILKIMFTTLTRVIKSGFLSFWRNKWLSSTAIFMMSLAIFGITSLILTNVLINSLIDGLEDKIDVSVYFKLDTSEDSILSVRSDLVKLAEVKSVEYISTDEALINFKERHKDNEVLIQSLGELDTNPLEASLNIKAKEASQYESIADFFNQGNYYDIVNKVNYLENKAVISRLSSITKTIRQVGSIAFLILAGLAILVTYNTIRLTIYTSRKEIKVMKLVGASNWFTRGPFVIEGILYGFVATLISLFVMYPLLWYLSPKITSYLPGTDLFYFFQVNLIVFFILQVLIGMALGISSSLVAIRRYLD